jgi:hypothetical protein
MQRLVVLLVVFVGCHEDNPASCELPGNAGIAPCPPDAPTAPPPCQRSNECTANPDLPVCEMGTCVHCTLAEHDLCTPTSPRCENHMCVKCVSDNDCAQSVCMPDGSCAAQASIIHVKVNGSMTSGCGDIGSECTLASALTLVTGTRNVIKIDDAGPHVPVMNSFVVGIDVTIDARGATLHHNGGDDPIVRIAGGKTVTILGGTIEGAKGNNGNGIRCDTGAKLTMRESFLTGNDAAAINADGCTLVVTDATLHDNNKKTDSASPGITISGGDTTLARSRITSNAKGGININGNAKFTIIGNAFLNNGSLTGGSAAAVFIMSSTDPNNRLEFNTIAANKSAAGDTSGVQCSGSTFVARNNIIWNNLSIGISGSCMHAYSDIGPVVTFNDAGNNINMNPNLLNEATDPHVQAASPVHQKADPQANLMGVASRDIDGDPRIAPADIGADQMK